MKVWFYFQQGKNTTASYVKISIHNIVIMFAYQHHSHFYMLLLHLSCAITHGWTSKSS